MTRLFKKLLIANRGEITCRVIRTARRLGIRTVAVYSEPDARAPHVTMADEAVCVGSAASVDSYLRVDRIMDAIRQTGAEAVHPGYGFLSENAEFAEAVEAEGVAFVGPSAYAIRAMGDKIESKKLADAAGVSTIPGFLGVLSGEEEAVEVANKVGYPVMLKASAGGGGKGMRIAWNDAEAAQGFTLSAREAASSFGDDRIFIERFVEKPRHIEIQLVADSHGNCVYLPERECSVQRRNQKVVEEAPAWNLRPETVAAMGEEAVALAKAVGYRSAGTVEFLVDARQQHYFLEMNTRLQVEHPVTEMVTGLDLVEVMLRVAAGEKLPVSQADVRRTGWAIESRVYAEDPLRGFLPSTGTLSRYQPPSTAECAAALGEAASALAAEGAAGVVRVDDGIVEGGEISIHYDPMIAKLITYGRDRDHARRLMLAALDRYTIRGVRHNINFLRTIMANQTFMAGEYTTNFIPEEFPDGYAGHELSASERRDLLAATAALQVAADAQEESVGGGAGAPRSRQLAMKLEQEGEGEIAISVSQLSGSPCGAVAGSTLLVEELCPDSGAAAWQRTLRIDSTGLGPEAILQAAVADGCSPSLEDARPFALQVVERRSLGWELSAYGSSYKLTSQPPLFAKLSVHMKPPKRSALADAMLSPMPGTLLSVAVAEGDAVVMGQEMCVVEAMKMQNVLYAPRDGKVKSVLAGAGSVLRAEQPILMFEKEECAAAA